MSPRNASAKISPGGFGACVHARADAGDITPEEAPLLVRSLLSAGLDTVNGIGAAVYCLARFPDQFARLRSDPTLARNAFEEAIRSKARCRPSSAPRRGRSNSQAIASAKARRC